MAKRKNKIRKRILNAIPVEELVATIKACRGNLYAVGRCYGCTGEAVHMYGQRNPEIQTAIREARGMLVTKAESVVNHHLEKNSLRAAEFVLQTLGKKYGYIKQLELAGADPTTGALPIQITMPANGREINPVPVTQNAKDESENDAPAASGDDSEIVPVPEHIPATGTANTIHDEPG